MTLHSITLENFRSFENASFCFCEGVNVISGPNGTGKTNLLEAIYFCATSKSTRTAKDADLIRFSCREAAVGAAFSSRERSQTLGVKLRHGTRRVMELNGVVLRSPRELMGLLPAIFFEPGDLSLLQGGAAERRVFMDAALCQQKPRYLETLRRYRKLHESKTRLLGLCVQSPKYLELLPDYNRGLAETGEVLASYRKPFVEELEQAAARHHSAISGGRERLSLTYAAKALDAGETLRRMGERREAELARRQCLVGAHRDDIEAQLNGKTLRGFSSQGQARTAAVAMKLAVREILSRSFGEAPLLLLDDVLSELDEARQRYVLDHVGGGQTFITCCEAGKITLSGANIMLG